MRRKLSYLRAQMIPSPDSGAAREGFHERFEVVRLRYGVGESVNGQVSFSLSGGATRFGCIAISRCSKTCWCLTTWTCSADVRCDRFASLHGALRRGSATRKPISSTFRRSAYTGLRSIADLPSAPRAGCRGAGATSLAECSISSAARRPTPGDPRRAEECLFSSARRSNHPMPATALGQGE